jgi:hypothetical protein
MANKKHLQAQYHELRMIMGTSEAAKEVGIAERTARDWNKELHIGKHVSKVTWSEEVPDAPATSKEAIPASVPGQAPDQGAYAAEAEEDDLPIPDEQVSFPFDTSADLPVEQPELPMMPTMPEDLDPDRSITESPVGRVRTPGFDEREPGYRSPSAKRNPNTGGPAREQAPDPRFAPKSQVEAWKRKHRVRGSMGDPRAKLYGPGGINHPGRQAR